MNSKQHWEQVYEQRRHDSLSWYQACPTRSLELIEACHLERGAAIIDIGGGASTLVDHLLARQYQNLSVLDISALALQAAQQRLGADARGIHWLEYDIRDFRPPQHYALWHDRAVFHFLVDADARRQYLKVLRSGLRHGGYLIMATFTKNGPRQCSGLDIVQYDADSLAGELGTDFKLLRVEMELHQTPAGGQQAFQYCLFMHDGKERG